MHSLFWIKLYVVLVSNQIVKFVDIEFKDRFMATTITIIIHNRSKCCLN